MTHMPDLPSQSNLLATGGERGHTDVNRDGLLDIARLVIARDILKRRHGLPVPLWKPKRCCIISTNPPSRPCRRRGKESMVNVKISTIVKV